MAAPLIDRLVKGPDKDWLSKSEVCAAVEVGDRTLDRMIERGEFPAAVSFPGENRARWRWEDVAWFLLGRQIAARLAPPAPPGGDEDDNGAQPPAKRAQPPAK